MAHQSINNDDSVIIIAEYRRTVVPVSQAESETSDIICLGESVIVPQPRLVRDDAHNELQEVAAASLPPSQIRVDPDTPLVAEVKDPIANTVTITSSGNFPNTVRGQWANDQAVGAVDECRPEKLVYDLAMPAPATWEEPTPTTCCGRWPYYCRCHIQGTSSGSKRRGTPYPDRNLIANIMERSDTPTSVQGDENDDPESGRSTSLGDIMDWDPCCVTPEVEYTPETSPFPGRPAKRRQLPLKPSLVEEVQPTEPSLPPTPEPTPNVNTQVHPTEPNVEPAVRVNPITSCDGFRVRFTSGGHAIVTRIVLVGVNMSLSILSEDRVVLQFTPLVTGQGAATTNVPFNAPEAPSEGATGTQIACLTNFRVDLGAGCYALVGGITLKGVKIEKYDYEAGGVGLAIHTN